MNIQHHPVFDTEKVIKHYSEKDGVDIKYVCTTDGISYDNCSVDIFYRDTPHPEFGNRYFGLYRIPVPASAGTEDRIMICSADHIEDLDFAMIEDNSGKLWYSAYRHDYRVVDGKMIDGGRAYIRTNTTVKVLKVKDGEFISTQSE